MVKRSLLIFVLFILVVFFMSFGFVGAKYTITGKATADEVGQSIDGIIETLKPLVESLVGNTPNSEWLFAKFLFLMIVFAIVWKIVGQMDLFKKNSWVVWILSAIVSILSVRWIDSVDLIQTILLPYSTLAIAISAGIPFVIFFLLVTFGMKNAPPTARRLAWIFFGIIFTGMWIARIGELGDAGYLYLVFGIASFIMIKMDGTFQRWMDQIAIENTLTVTDQVKYVRLLKERSELQETLFETAEEGLRGKIEASIEHIDNALKELKIGAYRKMGKNHKSVL